MFGPLAPSSAWASFLVCVHMHMYYSTGGALLFFLIEPTSTHRFTMKLLLTITALLLLVGESTSERILSRRTKRELAGPLHVGGIRDPFGSYCQRRGGCCPGRDDQCTVPYLDTICYCDLFCNRTVSDCCPDFWGHCLGIQPPFIGMLILYDPVCIENKQHLVCFFLFWIFFSVFQVK